MALEISCLPHEIARHVCAYLRPQDVANVRLVSKYWHDVSTEHLLREVQLIFQLESFERLLAIARHPIIGRHITSLLYSPNMLDSYDTSEDWEEHIFADQPSDDFLQYHGLDAPENIIRNYEEEIYNHTTRPQHPYSRNELDLAYQEYEQTLAAQSNLRRSDYGADYLYDAMLAMPQLSHLCMNMWHKFGMPTRYERDAYRATLQRPGGDDEHSEPGVPHIKSLLLGAAWANLRLEALRVGIVYWNFVRQSEDVLGEFMRVFSSLKLLDLSMSVCNRLSQDLDRDVRECRNYLKNNVLADLLAAASDLTDLSVGFDWNEPYAPAEIKDVVQTNIWPTLTSVGFQMIDAHDQDWLSFFDRHALTLRRVSFDTIRLTKGTWPKVLEQMHELLTLTSVSVQGFLLGIEPWQRWDLGSEIPHPQSPLHRRTRTAVQNYLLGEEGQCPLLDEDTHPQ